MSFGTNLAKIRKNKNLTQDELSNISKINASQIRKYETDASIPSITIAAKLAIALGTSTDELIFDNGKRVANKRILDKDLLEKFEKIMELNDEDIKTARNMLDGLIIRHQVKNMAK